MATEQRKKGERISEMTYSCPSCRFSQIYLCRKHMFCSSLWTQTAVKLNVCYIRVKSTNLLIDVKKAETTCKLLQIRGK